MTRRVKHLPRTTRWEPEHCPARTPCRAKWRITLNSAHSGRNPAPVSGKGHGAFVSLMHVYTIEIFAPQVHHWSPQRPSGPEPRKIRPICNNELHQAPPATMSPTPAPEAAPSATPPPPPPAGAVTGASGLSFVSALPISTSSSPAAFVVRKASAVGGLSRRPESIVVPFAAGKASAAEGSGAFASTPVAVSEAGGGAAAEAGPVAGPGVDEAPLDLGDLDLRFCRLPLDAASRCDCRCRRPPVPSSSESESDVSCCLFLSHRRTAISPSHCFNPLGLTRHSLILVLFVLHLVVVLVVVPKLWHFCSSASSDHIGKLPGLPCICTLGAAFLSLNTSNTASLSLSRYSGVLWSVMFDGRTSSS